MKRADERTRIAFLLTKTLSENRQIEQDVGAGKLNEGQPVFGLLGPASAQAASLEEPGNRPLHHPSPRRMRLPMRGESFRCGDSPLNSVASFFLGLILMWVV